jgi:CheY-like chemotaxis protein
VSTGAVQLEHTLAAYESIEAGDYAVLRVSDSRRGIERQDLRRIFEPFFTKKPTSEQSGSGLGLSIVHGVVKEHDGFVDVRSEPGRGTEFMLYFQRSSESAKRRDSGPAAARGSARILVVDDDPVQLRTVRRVLGRLGYEVVATRSGARAEALCGGAHQVGRRARPFDLLIVDMLLNERDDGLALFERIERHLPGQRGIIVSGHAPSGRVQLATLKGLAWLAKPFGSDDLARAVQAALAPHSGVRTVAAEVALQAKAGLALERRASDRP